MEENLLMKALFAYWTTEGVLAAFKGGLTNGEADESAELPYASVENLASSKMIRTARNNYRLVTFDVVIVAETQEKAVNELGEKVRTKTEDKEASLSVGGGMSVQDITKTDVRLEELDTNKWVYEQSFEAQVSRARA